MLKNIDGFTDIIDDLGGIDMPVSDAMPNDCFVISPGTVHMNGKPALCCVRERSTTSDITCYRDTIRTNMQVDDLVPLVPVVIELHQHGFLYYQIDWDDFISWQIPETGARVHLPDRKNMLPVIQHASDVLFTPMDEEEK